MKNSKKTSALEILGKLPKYQEDGQQALTLKLETINELLDSIDKPQDNYPSIHIAGTNGKGSTAHILAALLQANGLKVGVYTSPHYNTHRERIKINGKKITAIEVEVFIDKTREVIERIMPSFYEVSVAMGFEHFSRHSIDIAIVETGLGGRYDATNVLNPLISLITTIDYDHQHILGDTLEEIAAEKAGIIKHNTPVIIGHRQEDLLKIYENAASANDAELHFAESLVNVEIKESHDHALVLSLINQSRSCELKPDIAGNFQIFNFKNAIAAYRLLNRIDLGFSLRSSCDFYRKAVRHIQSSTAFMGRWQLLSDSPMILADSAHNVQGLRQVFHQLNTVEYEVLHIVLGFVNEKKLKDLIKVLPQQAQYYCVAADSPRSMDTEILHKELVLNGLKSRYFSTLSSGIKEAIMNASEYDIIYIGGSTYVTAEALQWWNKHNEL